MVASAPHAALISVPMGAVPGIVLDLVSLVAGAPDEFLWGRSIDAWSLLGTAHAMMLHAAVLRWTLDELALPARLFTDFVELLYRHDSFANET